MMFSTKAEYGVRVMVELARGMDGEPVALAEIAARGGLPLAYLEHLVARLRKAGLVDSRRGSRRRGCRAAAGRARQRESPAAGTGRLSDNGRSRDTRPARLDRWARDPQGRRSKRLAR